MRVRTSTLRTAFFRIYRELATPEADFVSVNEMRDAWHATGLRHSDLMAVIQDLIRERMLQALDQGSELIVRLELTGVLEYHQPGTRLSRSMQDWLTLARVSWRRVRDADSWRRRERKRRREERRF